MTENDAFNELCEAGFAFVREFVPKSKFKKAMRELAELFNLVKDHQFAKMSEDLRSHAEGRAEAILDAMLVRVVAKINELFFCGKINIGSEELYLLQVDGVPRVVLGSAIPEDDRERFDEMIADDAEHERAAKMIAEFDPVGNRGQMLHPPGYFEMLAGEED